MNNQLKDYFINILTTCKDEDIDFFLESASMELNEADYNEAYQAAYSRYLMEEDNGSMD